MNAQDHENLSAPVSFRGAIPAICREESNRAASEVHASVISKAVF